MVQLLNGQTQSCYTNISKRWNTVKNSDILNKFLLIEEKSTKNSLRIWDSKEHLLFTSLRVNLHSSNLNVKELLARKSIDIWGLSDSNRIRTHNHLVLKRTFNHLAKLASLNKWLIVCLGTKLLWVRIPLLLLKKLWIYRCRESHKNSVPIGRDFL